MLALCFVPAAGRQTVALLYCREKLRSLCADDEEFARRDQAALLRSMTSAIPPMQAYQIEIEHAAKGI